MVEWIGLVASGFQFLLGLAAVFAEDVGDFFFFDPDLSARSRSFLTISQILPYTRSIIDMVFSKQWARIKGHKLRPNATYPIPMARPIRPTVMDLSERS